jgi:nucleoid-associated protein YgaU
VKEETEETAETAKGEEYVIVWGDTLWDISRRYYRDPFQYKMLAKVNKIQNPDLIFAKQKIFIPAK